MTGPRSTADLMSKDLTVEDHLTWLRSCGHPYKGAVTVIERLLAENRRLHAAMDAIERMEGDLRYVGPSPAAIARAAREPDRSGA